MSSEQKPLYPWSKEVHSQAGIPTSPEEQKKTILYSPLKLRGLELKNRWVVSPMCMYSSDDGFFTDYHLVHLGQFALGGAALVIAEATAVSAEGRISPNCTGLWKDEHIDQLRKIANFFHANGTPFGIQLAHAGRKASTFPPFVHTGDRHGVPVEQGGWIPVAPTAEKFTPEYILPEELTIEQIQALIQKFVDATKRADAAGLDMIEIHGSHGYLLTNFYSQFTNKRTDQYGGSFENRIRLVIEIATAVRAAFPQEKPVWIRLNGSDWIGEAGWEVQDLINLVKALQQVGLDVVDVSSGGNAAHQQIKVGPGYQVHFADALKKAVPEQKVAAVGAITNGPQAEEILQQGSADLILAAREFLRDPHLPMRAAQQLGVRIHFTPQYSRAHWPSNAKL